jgi:hypothetical protein
VYTGAGAATATGAGCATGFAATLRAFATALRGLAFALTFFFGVNTGLDASANTATGTAVMAKALVAPTIFAVFDHAEKNICNPLLRIHWTCINNISAK